jgi:hypothetical protein
MNTKEQVFGTWAIPLALIFALAACSKTEPPPLPAASAPPAAKPDPAAECAKAATAWFKGAYGEGSKTLDDGRTTKAGHQARYNAKRKQCLVRLTADTAAKDPRPAVTNVSLRALGDKNAMLASVVHVRDKLTYCVVEGKKCQTLQEWDALTAPLMTE